MAKGSRLPCTEGVRVGVIPKAFTFLSMGTGEPDDAKVSCPVRGGTGRKGSNDLARGLPYLVPRSGFRRQVKRRRWAPRAREAKPRENSPGQEVLRLLGWYLATRGSTTRRRTALRFHRCVDERREASSHNIRCVIVWKFLQEECIPTVRTGGIQ